MSPLPLSTPLAGLRWTSSSSTGFQRWPKVLTYCLHRLKWDGYRSAAQASSSCWANLPLQMGSNLFGTQWTRWRWWLWTGRDRRSWRREWWPILRGAYSANTWHGRLSSSISYITSCLQRVDFAALGYPPPIYVNMVRDPVERLVSWFYYIRAAWSVESSERVVKYFKGTSWTASRPSQTAPFLRLPGSARLTTTVLQTHVTQSANIPR